jgi:hypothetical protein
MLYPAPEVDMPRIAALVFLLVLSPSIAIAQEIPEYDTQAHCERVAESAAEPSAALERCLWLEEYALDELETFWPRASGPIREECLEATSGEESYMVLVRCVMGRLRRSRGAQDLDGSSVKNILIHSARQRAREGVEGRPV